MADVAPSSALHPLTSSELEKADVAAGQMAATQRGRLSVRVAGMLSEIADQPQLAALCCATILGGLVRQDPRLTRTGLGMLAAHALATGMKSLMKNSVKRTRPFVLAEESRYEMSPGGGRESKESSFPSGHTSSSVAVADVVAHSYPKLKLPAFGAAAAIALIQVPRAKHYPGDLVAGALIGLMASGLAKLSVDLAQEVLSNLRGR